MQITVKEAIALLKEGEVIGFPTETVYGLAASVFAPKAQEKIYALKNRPEHKPLPIQVALIGEISPFTETFPPGFLRLAEKYWPGPLTLVIPTPKRIGFPTTAFRIPDHPLALEVLAGAGPLFVTSANLSGEAPPSSAEEVATLFGPDFPLLDGGPCREKVASTLLAWEQGTWRLVRQGSQMILETEVKNNK